MNTIYINKAVLGGSWLIEQDIENILELIQTRGELLRSKDGKSVFRLSDNEAKNPYFIKTWCANGFKDWVKNYLKIANPYAEFRNKQYLESIKVPCAGLYFFGVTKTETCKKLYIQVSEYIETNQDAAQHIRELLADERHDEVGAFSNKIILLTKALLDARFVDPDHRMENLMVNETDELVKIDLEIGSIMSNYRCYDQKIGQMVGTLIYSYIFAVYPHLDIAQEFSDSVIQKMNLSNRARKHARKLIDDVLAKQLAEINVDSRITLNF